MSLAPFRKQGFAVVSILIISLVLFALLTTALTTCYWLHSLNHRAKTDLQKRAGPLAQNPQTSSRITQGHTPE